MTDGVAIALVSAVGATLAAAIAAFVQLRSNAHAATVDRAKKDKALAEIHVLVNSRLTEALGEIVDLKKTIAALLPGDLNKAQAAGDAAKDVVLQVDGPAGVVPPAADESDGR